MADVKEVECPGGSMYNNNVYILAYQVKEPNPEEGEVEGFWTGAIDASGKLTIRPINGRPPLYLFPREIIGVDDWEEDR